MHNLVLFSIPLHGKPVVVTLWTLFGLVGNILFSLRVLVQWIASERARKSVVPVSFWWISLAATLVFIIYSIGKITSEGIGYLPFLLGVVITLVPYLRNLWIHYRPADSPRGMRLIIASAIVMALIPAFFFKRTQTATNAVFYIGLLGNAIFGARFFVQWVQSEARQRSVMGLAFWYVSLVGSVIMLIYGVGLLDLVIILSYLFNSIPYVRNILLIRRRQRLGPSQSP